MILDTSFKTICQIVWWITFKSTTLIKHALGCLDFLMVLSWKRNYPARFKIDKIILICITPIHYNYKKTLLSKKRLLADKLAFIAHYLHTIYTHLRNSFTLLNAVNMKYRYISSMNSKPIKICKIRPGSKPYWKILYGIVSYQVF